MKQFIALLIIAFSISTAGAQISVKVRKTNSGGDVDIKTSGKPKTTGTNQGTGEQTTTTPTEPKTTPSTTKDTASRPVATSGYDESYNGPAKVQLKAFWRQLDKLRTGDMGALNNAERMLGQVKQNDSKYDVSALETEVKSYREKVDGDAKAKSQAAGKADAEKNYFKSVWSKMVGVYSTASIIEPGVTGKAYLERVQDVDLPGYLEKRKSVTDAGPNSYPVLIDEMLADYENYLKRTDRLRWNVTEVMVKARNEANPQTKMKMLEQAKYECEAVLIMSSNNAAFKQKLDEVNKLLGNADVEASKNYTSDFHKQNVGKIVWSNKPLVIGKEKDMAASIKTEFKTGEAIFGTIYLGNAVKQLMDGNERLRVIIKVDGGTAVWGGDLSNFIVPLATQDKSYLQFALLPDEDWFSKNYAPYLTKENWTYSYFMDDLVQAGDISHSITCEFDFPNSIQSNIKSQVSLDLGSGISQLKSLSTKLHDQMMATRTLPKAGMSNSGLEAQMLAAANNLGWNDKFLKTIITSSAWVISKNELTGAILYRYLGAVCTIKGTDGKCYYQEFSFRQDYTGGGNYSNTVKYNSYGGKREIGCDKIK
jgi:hypothetical protein